MVVDDDAVVGQQLGRHRAHAGRRRHGQRGVHVLDDAGRGAAQRGAASGRRATSAAAGGARAARLGRAAGTCWEARSAARFTTVPSDRASTGWPAGGVVGCGGGRGLAGPAPGAGAAAGVPGCARLRVPASAAARGGRAPARRPAAPGCCRLLRPAVGRCGPRRRHRAARAVVGEELVPGLVDAARDRRGTAGTSPRPATRWCRIPPPGGGVRRTAGMSSRLTRGRVPSSSVDVVGPGARLYARAPAGDAAA